MITEPNFIIFELFSVIPALCRASSRGYPKSIRTFAGTLVNLKRFSGEPPLMGSPCVVQTTLAIAVVTYYRLSHVVLKAQC